MYAIVDIETTGVSYKTGKITEIAILIHDGKKIVEEFSTLINPEQKIPYRIQQLTGISNRMTEQAPKFYEVAGKIAGMLKDRIFVAHNVGFDYNFIRQEFKYLGYDFRSEKLCTVKLSRKLIPFRKSYSLGNLCEELNIQNPHRHRAYGDAQATVRLFEMLLAINPNPAQLSIQGLNSSLDRETLKNLPEETGVYYFLDENKKIIYVGKSRNIRSRVMSHLTNSTTRRALEMKNKAADIDHVITGSEMIALLLEAHEISKHKPLYNRALRHNSYNYGLFYHTDEKGYIRFELTKLANGSEDPSPLTTFNSAGAAKDFLFDKAEKYRLCQKLCGLYAAKGSCFQYKIGECNGACLGIEPPAAYNARATELIKKYQYEHQSFFVLDRGRSDDEHGVVLVENGRYCGFGYVEKNFNGSDPLSLLRGCIRPYTENKHVHSIIRSYIAKHPSVKIIEF